MARTEIGWSSWSSVYRMHRFLRQSTEWLGRPLERIPLCQLMTKQRLTGRGRHISALTSVVCSSLSVKYRKDVYLYTLYSPHCGSVVIIGLISMSGDLRETAGDGPPNLRWGGPMLTSSQY